MNDEELKQTKEEQLEDCALELETDNVIKQDQEAAEAELDRIVDEEDKPTFPVFMVVVIGVLIAIVVTLIILLYAFGGPLPGNN